MIRHKTGIIIMLLRDSQVTCLASVSVTKTTLRTTAVTFILKTSMCMCRHAPNPYNHYTPQLKSSLWLHKNAFPVHPLPLPRPHTDFRGRPGLQAQAVTLHFTALLLGQIPSSVSALCGQLIFGKIQCYQQIKFGIKSNCRVGMYVVPFCCNTA